MIILTFMLALMLAALLSLGVPCGGEALQEAPAAGQTAVRTFFSVRSAKPDAEVPEELTKSFENYDGQPLYSLEYDLDGDGETEKFILFKGPGLSRGNQWLVFSRKSNSVLGIIIGSMIFVHQEAPGNFPVLESYWKQGGSMAVVFEYSFSGNRYTRQSSRSLSPVEISDFFRSKPPIDPDLELVETKSPSN